MPFSDFLAQALPIAGAVAGSALGQPAAGASIGSLLGGIAGQGRANRLEKEMTKAENIPLYDPMQMSYLDKVRRQQRAFQAGADPMTAYRTNQARNAQAQTAANLTRVGGGNSASLVQNLLRAQSGTNQAVASAGVDANNQAMNLMNLEGGLVSGIANRALALQQQRRDIAMSRYARARQDANNNIMAGLGMLPELKFGKQPMTPMQVDASEAPVMMNTIAPTGISSMLPPRQPIG